MRIKMSHTAYSISYHGHMTLESLRGDTGDGESSDMGHWLFLKSTCDTGTPSSRAPLSRCNYLQTVDVNYSRLYQTHVLQLR